ncbi:MAG: SH3 domain-containing protein [Candidatus Marinimicrobia bacterium]|nr:SH3 domain-containing protein [Candidatus Neomarinimicrobiota bacterium]
MMITALLPSPGLPVCGTVYVRVLADPSELTGFREGDLVTVTGVVDDDHEAYWQWQTNTYVVGSVSVKLQGEAPISPTPVSLANLEDDPEAWEGVLVDISDGGEIASINSYDLTLTDGSSSFLLDDDIVPDSILDINYMENAVVGGTDTLLAGDSFDNIKGVVMYSYGSVKIEVRKPEDMTIAIDTTSVTDIPADFTLGQNYCEPLQSGRHDPFRIAESNGCQITGLRYYRPPGSRTGKRADECRTLRSALECRPSEFRRVLLSSADPEFIATK